MFARLLVGLDGSVGAEVALATAIELGRRFFSTIQLAVVEPPGGRTGRAGELLEHAAARVRDAGLVFQAAATPGEADRELLRLAERAEAIVVGRHGEQHTRRGALGDVTTQLVRRCPKPVLVAGEEPSRCLRPVVAYDGSETSTSALALAARYAEAVGTSLDVVNVASGPAASGELLARAEAFLSAQAVQFATHQLTGEVTAAIAAHVERGKADLLAVGAHGGGRRASFVGSHAEGLLRATTVPVIVNR